MAVRWRAPGRVNLLGEHTDYNAGFVLPFAITLGCTAEVHRRSDRLVQVSSAQVDGAVQAPLEALEPGAGGWAGYALGVVWELRRRGLLDDGVSIGLDSDVPLGSGLSSSAAVVCAVATALDDLLGLGLPADDLLALTRAAENDFVGAPTGGMDQLASLRSEAGSVLFCDMRSLHSRAVPFALGSLAILVVDTRTGHRHADGEYRRRREGCEAAARLLGVPALRDVDLGALPAALNRLDDDELRRYTRHVVTEDDRVLRAVDLLEAGRAEEIGPLMTASHVSMRDDFRISGPELDLAVDTMLASSALGARMTGGGFGGCAIALVARHDVGTCSAAVTRAFADAGLTAPVTFTADPAQGAHRLTEAD